MKRLLVVLSVFLCFLCGMGQSNAAIVESTFDSDTEGWTVYNDGSLSWSSTGGNPGGYLLFNDTGPDGYGTNAPAEFLGDLRLFDGGSLSFDYRVISRSGLANLDVGSVKLWTSDTSFVGLNFIGEELDRTTDWTTYSMALTAEAWGVDQSDWLAVLSDVTRISIYVEPGGFPDSCGLDNVRMVSPVPIPSSILLFGTGIVGIIGAYRKKRFNN